MRTPQCLAVDAEKLCSRWIDQRVQPLGETLLESLRLQTLQHTSDAVFRRDAVRQFHVLLQLGFRTVGPREDRRLLRPTRHTPQ